MKHRQDEFQLQCQVVEYIRLQYPKVLFKCNFADGIKLSMGQAVKLKRAGASRAWPDIFIAESKFVAPDHFSCDHAEVECQWYHGLFLELKKDGEELFQKRNPTKPINDHVAQQMVVIAELKERSYWAQFAIGFAEAKRVIDTYLNL